MVPPKQRNGNAGEPETGREVVEETVAIPHHIPHPSKTRDRPAQRHRPDRYTTHINPRVGGDLWGIADEANLISPFGACQQKLRQSNQSKRDEQRDV